MIGRTSPWLARATRLIQLPDYLIASLAHRMDILRDLLSPAFVTRQRGRDPFHELYDSIAPSEMLRGREPAKQLIYLWLKTIFPGYVLAADRADMAHGVEVRLPFLDHVLFEQVRTIPISALAREGQVKHLLRAAAAPFITPIVRGRQKQPLLAPPFTAHREDPLLTVVCDVLSSTAAREQPFFDARAIASKLNEQMRTGTGRASMDPILLMAASLCVLSRDYRINSS
jgi:asparagine synthase (glutamine-hydrolysing)